MGWYNIESIKVRFELFMVIKRIFLFLIVRKDIFYFFKRVSKFFKGL